jgi:hypothetical protein
VRSGALAAVVCLGTLAVPAYAQNPPLHRFELAAGIGLFGGASLGDAQADLRPSTAGPPYRVFDTSTTLESAPVLDLRAGFALTPRFGIEGRLLYGHPEVQTSITGDVEGAPNTTAVERLDQYLIDGGVIVSLHEFRVGGIEPFATGGAGYLRQLHEGLTVVDEGQVYYVGGGARYGLLTRPRGLPRALGVRGDVRLNLLSGGVTIEDKVRRHVLVSGSFFVVF